LLKINQMRIFITLACIIVLNLLSAQTTSSNLYLFDIRQTKDTVFAISNPRYLTSFNPQGYNNHPAFFTADKIYLSVKERDEAEPEIYAMSTDKLTLSRITDTEEGEYSPFMMPDNIHFSVVRTESSSGETIQRLWQLPLDKQGTGRPIFGDIHNVGYYQWLNRTEVVMFLVGSPHVLVLGNLDEQKTRPLTDSPGRCFRFIPGTAQLIYIQKDRYAEWMIMQRDLSSTDSSATPITAVPGDTEDFAILPDGTILMSQGSKILCYHPDKSKVWTIIADMQLYGIRRISRMAIHQTGDGFKLILVSES
jgi:hypothetical protein